MVYTIQVHTQLTADEVSILKRLSGKDIKNALQDAIQFYIQKRSEENKNEEKTKEKPEE